MPERPTDKEEEVFRRFGDKEEFRFFNRPLVAYLSMLFPDDPGITKWEMEHQPREIIAATGRGRKLMTLKPVTRAPAPDRWLHLDASGEEFVDAKKVGKIFGGKEDFFSKGTALLDIGAGGGTAVQEMTQAYSNLQVTALDVRYGEQPPSAPNRSNPTYVCARWNDLPFETDAFDRLISLESFPRYAWSENTSLEDIKRTVKEITRVAKAGALWRGSCAKDIAGRPKGEYIQNMLQENGWEVYWGKTFIARLERK
jgi:hypothetical protein